MDFLHRQDADIDVLDGEQTYPQSRRNAGANGECVLPFISEEPDDRRFGNHSMSYLDDYDRDHQQDERGQGSHHRYNPSSFDLNTHPQDSDAHGYREHYLDMDRGCRGLSPRREAASGLSLSHQSYRQHSYYPKVQEQDYFQTPSPYETATFGTDFSEASLSHEDLGHRELSALPSKRAHRGSGTLSCQKGPAFLNTRSMASQHNNQKYYSYPNNAQYHHQAEELKTSFRSNDMTVEVVPGEFLPLRGAIETWKAVQCDYFVPCTCLACSETIFCIQDASFVLCPVCRVVSPLESAVEKDGRAGGVGLGFTFDDLAKWQEELSVARLHESTAW